MSTIFSWLWGRGLWAGDLTVRRNTISATFETCHRSLPQCFVVILSCVAPVRSFLFKVISFNIVFFCTSGRPNTFSDKQSTLWGVRERWEAALWGLRWHQSPSLGFLFLHKGQPRRNPVAGTKSTAFLPGLQAFLSFYLGWKWMLTRGNG